MASQVGETYDWRLAVPNMEKRDHYFTRLKWRIELTHQTIGEKVLPPLPLLAGSANEGCMRGTPSGLTPCCWHMSGSPEELQRETCWRVRSTEVCVGWAVRSEAHAQERHKGRNLTIGASTSHQSIRGCPVRQVVVASHSWGDNVFRNFMMWATEEDAGWVEEHIAAYVNIAGPVLGVAKSMTSLLSGTPPPRVARAPLGPGTASATVSGAQEMPASRLLPTRDTCSTLACCLPSHVSQAAGRSGSKCIASQPPPAALPLLT